MRRREFIARIGGAAAWPLTAHAQRSDRTRRIGILMGGAAADNQSAAGREELKKGLAELGWIEGRNLIVDIRFSSADVEQMRVMAKELVSLQPDLLIGHTTQPVAALQRETSTIPIVFVVVSDPVGSGFVASLPRPGGNITGFINIESSLGGKWIELLTEIAPSVNRAALMFNPDTAPYAKYYLEPFEAAARSRSIEPIATPIRTIGDIERVIAALSSQPNASLAIMPDAFTATQTVRSSITSLSIRNRLPAIFPYRYWISDGGLISYGIDITDLFRRLPIYVDRIFKGAKVAELPVQLPTKFELAVNLKTASALGLTIPPTLLGRADEVIE